MGEGHECDTRLGHRSYFGRRVGRTHTSVIFFYDYRICGIRAVVYKQLARYWEWGRGMDMGSMWVFEGG